MSAPRQERSRAFCGFCGRVIQPGRAACLEHATLEPYPVPPDPLTGDLAEIATDKKGVNDAGPVDTDPRGGHRTLGDRRERGELELAAPLDTGAGGEHAPGAHAPREPHETTRPDTPRVAPGWGADL